MKWPRLFQLITMAGIKFLQLIFAPGSPSGSTPVDFLLQNPWQLAVPAVDKGEESSQDASPFTPRPRNYLIAKHRVSVPELF